MQWSEKFRLLGAGFLPLIIIFSVTGLFMIGFTRLVESSAVGAIAATFAALSKGRLNKKVLDNTLRKTLSVSCKFKWIILAALCFGKVFNGLGAVHAIESLFLDDTAMSRLAFLTTMAVCGANI